MFYIIIHIIVPATDWPNDGAIDNHFHSTNVSDYSGLNDGAIDNCYHSVNLSEHTGQNDCVIGNCNHSINW